MTKAIRTAKQLSHDERANIVQSWLCGGVVTDMAETLDVQQDTIRLVLYEEGWL